MIPGGSAHGAFSWGILDYLLEDGRVNIEAISATSAGAMNAALCAYGMLKGGKDGARAGPSFSSVLVANADFRRTAS